MQGYYTNSDESLIPMERPDTLAGRTLTDITPEELARLNEQRNEDRIKADKQRWELRSPLHWFENHNPKNSRAWLVVDPPDGKIPPKTAEARAAQAARAKARQGRGEADSYEDRSLYDRCITRGLPGSMMPAIYGNSYQIVQGPGFVAIGYEMVNELRVIPLDGRPHVGGAIRAYMGDARGRFEGTTLVVETTNFTDKVPYRGSSDKLRLIERFTPIAPNVVEWSVTFDDPATWARPWTFAMNLTRRPSRRSSTRATRATTRCATCSASPALKNALDRSSLPRLQDVRRDHQKCDASQADSAKADLKSPPLRSHRIPLAIGAAIALPPVPAGLSLDAWRYFALFTTVIVALITEPIPPAIIGLAGVIVGGDARPGARHAGAVGAVGAERLRQRRPCG